VFKSLHIIIASPIFKSINSVCSRVKPKQSQLRGASRANDDNEAQLTYLMNMIDEQLQNYQKGDYQAKTTVSQMLNEYKKLGIINLKQKTDIMKLFK
jgi:hypothetical protein